MQRFELCNAKQCAPELLALGQINMKMWYLFTWLVEHGELRHGTQAEVVKLYMDEQLVAYSLLENYEACDDKMKWVEGEVYQDLGVLHFVTLPAHRKKGYASLLAKQIYKQVIIPLLARHQDVNAYIVATERAVPLIQRAGIAPRYLVTQFYSDQTFHKKVIQQINPK
ncbi:GNAT family N-acetyltransferase [Psychromonas sp. 14N.309.X.WAT.B.A12]|jgi:GNAT superfamily N-acetyltransferase|uniref:GNAT family N-acetyltransferase n=1 Tax=unclassified Psychromonas TaxID=2614957 RepID=UPI0025B1C007|nr:GNAT family N-acetyltransferase [Psychromonas sp. 14N.309.X.WAT.B.A12]MDN2662534.1 GNAT family N-acetyltransferase [Psychromonas sp. 14N.309.X.WAT.B.A12]